MAEVGKQLKQPEKGWRRIDSENKNILLKNGWIKSIFHEYWNGAIMYSQENKDATVEFSFYGTKLRIISDANDQNRHALEINIDGNKEYYNERIKPDYPYQTLIYEKQNLEKKMHKVKISIMAFNTATYSRITLDAIDIDEDGYLLDPDHRYIFII